MNIWNDVMAADGRSYALRRCHPADQLRSKKGVFAFLKFEEFSDLKILYVQASNDLAEAEPRALKESKVYQEALKLGCSTVAVLITGSAGAAYRERIAALIANHHSPPLNDL